MKFFTESEINAVSFGCDDGYNRMAIRALIMADRLREKVGFPLVPTCAFRTREHDLVKGRSGNSKHTEGIAFDFACTDALKRGKIVEAAIELGFHGIGVHKDFVHVDIREDNLVLWLY